MMKFYKHFLSPLKSVLILTLVFSYFRLLELFLHRSHLFLKPVDTLFNLIFAFLLDFLFFVLWNSFYFLFHFMMELTSLDSSYKQRKIFFWVLNIPLLILFFADMQTFSVSGQLMNQSVWSAFKIEIVFKIWVLIRDYWELILVFLLGLFFILKYCPVKTSAYRLTKNKDKWLAVFYWFGLLIGSYTALSYSSKKISNSFYQETFYNGMYFRIFFKKQKPGMFFSKEIFEKNIYSIKQPALKKEKKSFNVVIIVIESFEKDYLTKKQMPFLYKLFQDGFFLKNHFSFPLTTQLNVKSIFRGLSPYMPYIARTIKEKNGPLHIFQKAGWQTVLFWGDESDTLNFKKIAKDSGISSVFTQEDYLKDTNRHENIGAWGDIYEKPFMQFAAQKLQFIQSSFVVFILTNEPHYPYDCPGLKNTDTIKRRIEYCHWYIDQAIESFFQSVKKAEWFNQTLFVFTGDHVSRYFKKRTLTWFERYNTPLLFWSQHEKFKQYNSEGLSFHSDILPSILDYLGLPLNENFLINNNFIFRPRAKNRLIYYSSPLRLWFLREENYLLGYNIVKNQSHLWEIGPSLKQEKFQPTQMPNEILIDNEALKIKYENLLKTYIQYYHYGIKSFP